MMPIHNLKARTLTDYNKDLGLEIKVRAKYEIYIRTGLMGYVCLLPALPSALCFGRPHPEFAEPSRKISIDITAIWIRPRITRHGFALQITFMKSPGRSFPCSILVGREPRSQAAGGAGAHAMVTALGQAPTAHPPGPRQRQPTLTRIKLFKESIVNVLQLTLCLVSSSAGFFLPPAIGMLEFERSERCMTQNTRYNNSSSF